MKISSKGIIHVRRHRRLNLLIILIGAVSELLYRYSNNSEIILGTSIYKQEVFGDFINSFLVLKNSMIANNS